MAKTAGERIVGRINGMYDDMDATVSDQVLLCVPCGKTEPSKPADDGSYFRRGWPVCCGQTMGLVSRTSHTAEGEQR